MNEDDDDDGNEKDQVISLPFVSSVFVADNRKYIQQTVHMLKRVQVV